MIKEKWALLSWCLSYKQLQESSTHLSLSAKCSVLNLKKNTLYSSYSFKGSSCAACYCYLQRVIYLTDLWVMSRMEWWLLPSSWEAYVTHVRVRLEVLFDKWWSTKYAAYSDGIAYKSTGAAGTVTFMKYPAHLLAGLKVRDDWQHVSVLKSNAQTTFRVPIFQILVLTLHARILRIHGLSMHRAGHVW